MAAGDIRTALDLLPRAVKTSAHSKNPGPGSVRSRTELANVYATNGEAYAASGGAATARPWFQRSKQIFTDLGGAGELDANDADMLRGVEEELAKPGKTR